MILSAIRKGNKPILLAVCLLLTACSGGKSTIMLGIDNQKLALCPSTPNCVCSDASDSQHRIEPLRLREAAEDAWREVQSRAAALPGAKIVTAESDYLHVECRSKVFGFVDDLELHLRRQEGIIAVRSAARLGYFDFGVNRKRVEQLRSELSARGVLEPRR